MNFIDNLNTFFSPQLARGGSRVPIFDPYPKDDAKWKKGKGELLEVGGIFL